MGKLMEMGCSLHPAMEMLGLVTVTKGSMLEMSLTDRVQSGDVATFFFKSLLANPKPN
jgi:hypothetical protein